MYKSSLLIIFLTLFLATSDSMGQSHIGLFGGLNLSKLSGDAPHNGSYHNLAGANLGGFFDIKLAHGIYLGLHPSYSQEGTKVFYEVQNMEDPVDSIKIRLNYFSLPVLLKISSPNKRYYALAGFESGLLLNSSASIGDESEEINAEVAEWNFAIHFGAGIRISVGKPNLFFELRYTQGLMNLTDQPLSGNTLPRVKSSGFKLLGGIEIPIKLSKI